MPRPLSRLFPKISVKADFAQLVLQPNAIATLIDADSPAHPTRPAPKNLPIILGRSFRFTLRVNIPQFSLSLLSNHLRQALQAVCIKVRVFGSKLTLLSTVCWLFGH